LQSTQHNGRHFRVLKRTNCWCTSRWLFCDQDSKSLWCINSYGIQCNVSVPPWTASRMY